VNILRNPDERIENSLSVEVLWFEPMLERVSAGHTELFLRWRRTYRGPEQKAEEYGRDNRDRDFAETHWFKRPTDISSFSVIPSRCKPIYLPPHGLLT